MASPFTVRQAGIAGLAAASLMLISQVSQLGLPFIVTESFWVATQSLRMGLALAAMFALLIALTGLFAIQGAATGRLGLIGYLTAVLGTMLVAGNWWYEAFIGPVLRQSAPDLLRTAPSGTIILGAVVTSAAFALGWATFGVASYRARIIPPRAAQLMVVAGVVGIVGLIAPFQAPLALAVGWIGWWLVGSDSRATQPGAASATAISR